jgi:predicted nuclease with TOPRIM domain
MDLSLLQNFKTLITTSLQSIIDDAVVQYENMRDELQEKITSLDNENTELLIRIKELNGKLEECNFSEDNFNRVSIISNLNKQIKELQNENSDLRNCLNKNIPMNPSLARVSSPSITDEVPEDNEIENEDIAVVEEPEDIPIVEEPKDIHLVEEPEDIAVVEELLEEIIYKEKSYYLVNDEIFTKKKNGKKGKCVGKMVKGKPKLNKKKKKVES